MFCLCKNYVNAVAQCAGVDIGRVSKHYAHAFIGNVGDGNFRPSFFIKSNISATDKVVVVKFHRNIANKWLFMTQRKIMAIILYL